MEEVENPHKYDPYTCSQITVNTALFIVGLFR